MNYKLKGILQIWQAMADFLSKENSGKDIKNTLDNEDVRTQW